MPNDTISPTNVLGPGESLPPSINTGLPGENGVFNISPPEITPSTSLALPTEPAAPDLTNPGMLQPPDTSLQVPYPDEPLDYSNIKDTEEAMKRSMDGTRNKQSAWLRIAHEFLNLLKNYPHYPHL